MTSYYDRQSRYRLWYYIGIFFVIAAVGYFCYFCYDRMHWIAIIRSIENKQLMIVFGFFEYNKIIGIVVLFTLLGFFILDKIAQYLYEKYDIAVVPRNFLIFYYPFLATLFAILIDCFKILFIENQYSFLNTFNFIATTVVLFILGWLLYLYKIKYSDLMYDGNISASSYIWDKLPKFKNKTVALPSNKIEVSASLPSPPAIVPHSSPIPNIQHEINTSQVIREEEVKEEEVVLALLEAPIDIEEDNEENMAIPNINAKKIIAPQEDGPSIYFTPLEIKLFKILARLKYMDVETAKFILENINCIDRLKKFVKYKYLDMITYDIYTIISLAKKGFDLAKYPYDKITNLSEVKTGELRNIRHELYVARAFVYYFYIYKIKDITIFPKEMQNKLASNNPYSSSTPEPDLLATCGLKGGGEVIEAIEIELHPNKFKLNKKITDYYNTNIGLVTYFIIDPKFTRAEKTITKHNNYYSVKYDIFQLSKINEYLRITNDWDF